MPKVPIHTRQRWLVQLCTLAAFAVLFIWGAEASAAVPMCGIHAQTVAAPPIGTPASSDVVGPGPCDPGTPLRAAGAPRRDAPEKLTFPDAPIRALPTLPRWLECPVVGRLSPADREHESSSTGFGRSIDRPPRA